MKANPTALRRYWRRSATGAGKSPLLQTMAVSLLLAQSAAEARVATGRDKTAAHNLSGRGDFLAVSGHALPIRFQVAFIAEREARKEIVALQGAK